MLYGHTNINRNIFSELRHAQEVGDTATPTQLVYGQRAFLRPGDVNDWNRLSTHCVCAR